MNESREPSDETVVTPRVEPVEAPDETIVTPRRARREATDETVAVSGASQSERHDETIVTPRASQAAAAAPAPPAAPRALSRNPAPPVDEPAPLELPPELAARMFKSPLDARYRVPEAPSPAPDHALPRRGVSPALPVMTSQRSGRRSASGTDTDANFGPVPESRPAPPPADRTGVRSTARANRRFGIGAVVGFGSSLIVAVGGLWLVAVLAFG